MHLKAMIRFHDRLLGPSWRFHHGHQAPVDGFVAPLRPCAARAALREQARSYICFGPIMSVPLSGPPCWFGLGLGQGGHVHGLGSPAPLRPCAARAALREQARSYICFGPVMSVPLSGPPCFSGLRLGQGCQVHGSRFPAPLRPCAARAALREQGLGAPPRSYICFGPVMSVPLPGPPCFSGLRLHHGLQVHGSRFPAPLRPCAARAALREQARSYICFGPIMSVPLPGPPCFSGLRLGQGGQVHAITWPALGARRQIRSAAISPAPVFP